MLITITIQVVPVCINVSKVSQDLLLEYYISSGSMAIVGICNYLLQDILLEDYITKYSSRRHM